MRATRRVLSSGCRPGAHRAVRAVAAWLPRPAPSSCSALPRVGCRGRERALGRDSAPMVASWSFNVRCEHPVPNDTNATDDAFVRDLQTGVTERVSVSDAEAQGQGASFGWSISGDGRFVAFYSGRARIWWTGIRMGGPTFSSAIGLLRRPIASALTARVPSPTAIQRRQQLVATAAPLHSYRSPRTSIADDAQWFVRHLCARSHNGNHRSGQRR